MRSWPAWGGLHPVEGIPGWAEPASQRISEAAGELKAGKGSFAKIDQLQAQFDELTRKIDGLMDKINSGQGTIGQLMVNPQLNAALDGATREFQALVKGLEATDESSSEFRG